MKRRNRWLKSVYYELNRYPPNKGGFLSCPISRPCMLHAVKELVDAQQGWKQLQAPGFATEFLGREESNAQKCLQKINNWPWIGLGAAPYTRSLSSSSHSICKTGIADWLTDKAFLLKARLGFIKTSHFKLAKLRIFKAIYSRKIKVRELQPNCWVAPAKRGINIGRFEKPLVKPAWRLNPSHVETWRDKV